MVNLIFVQHKVFWGPVQVGKVYRIKALGGITPLFHLPDMVA